MGSMAREARSKSSILCQIDEKDQIKISLVMFEGGVVGTVDRLNNPSFWSPLNFRLSDEADSAAFA